MNKIIIISMIFFLSSLNSALAREYSTQDILLISGVSLEHNGVQLDLLSKIKSEILNVSSSTTHFLGHALFIEAPDHMSGITMSYFNKILDSNSVNVGLLKYENETILAIIITPDITNEKRTLILSDLLEFNITDLLPASVPIGAIGRINYTLLQTYSSPDVKKSIESVYNGIELAHYRVSNGLVNIASINGSEISQMNNLPFVIGNGSKTLRFFPKGLAVVGYTVTGALGGAGVGSAVPALGTVVGAVFGAIGAAMAKAGDLILENIKDDESGEALLVPQNLIPNSDPATAQGNTNRKDERTEIDMPKSTEKTLFRGKIHRTDDSTAIELEKKPSLSPPMLHHAR